MQTASTSPRVVGPAAPDVSPPDRPAVAPDPLLACLEIVCELHGQPLSAQALGHGAALRSDGRVAPEQLAELAAVHGLAARLAQRELATVDSLALPLILLLKDGSACVLLERPQRAGAGEDAARGQLCAIARPGEGLARHTLPWPELLAQASGSVLFVKPQARLDTRGDFQETVNPSRWFWSILWRYKGYYAHVAVATVVVNLLALAGSFFTLHVYDRVVPNQAYSTLWVLAAGTLLAAGFESAARMLRAWLTDVANKKSDLVMSAYLFRRVMGLRLDQKPASAGSFANTLRDFESVRDFAASATLVAVADLPFVLLFVGVIALLAGPLVAVPLAIMAVVLMATVLSQIPMSRLTVRYMQGMSRKQAVAVEAVDGLEALRAQGAEGMMQARWENSNAAMAAYSAKTKMVSSALTTFLGFAQQVTTVVMVTWGVYLIHDGKLTLGALIACVILMSRAVAPITLVAQLGVRFQQARTALKGLNGVMKLAQERDAQRSYLALPQACGAVGCNDVTHRFSADQAAPALSKVNLAVKPGERVAVLGRVGSGKSTLLRVAAGLLPANEGGITLDGLDIRQLEPTDVRRHVSWAGQEARLFYGTLRENIVMGDPSIPAHRLAEALRITGLDRVVAGHAKGLDLPIGENGQGLSGGQKQLVALARLLVRDPKVVMLDEPTSAMDQQTENHIMAGLKGWLVGRTLLMVTHRGHWLPLADRIVVMDAGRVVLDGPRDAVLAQLTQGVAVNATQGAAPSIQPRKAVAGTVPAPTLVATV